MLERAFRQVLDIGHPRSLKLCKSLLVKDLRHHWVCISVISKYRDVLDSNYLLLRERRAIPTQSHYTSYLLLQPNHRVVGETGSLREPS